MLISSTTLDLLDADFRSGLELEFWGPVKVKGRDQPLLVSELKMDIAPGAAGATQP